VQDFFTRCREATPESRLRALIAPPFHTVLDDLERNETRQYWLKGGRGSCKSSFVSLAIVHGIQTHPDTHAMVLRKIADNLASSVYTQLLWAIDMLGTADQWKAGKSPLELTYLPTGQRVYFRGADEPSKIKSVKLRTGYWRYIWFEEFDQFAGEEEQRNVLQSLMRGGDTFSVFCSYNPPRSVQSWTNAASIEPVTGRLVHHSTYEQVPPEWLGSAFIEAAESLRQRKPLAYEHEYMGTPTGSGGQVFDNLEIREIPDDELSRMANLHRGLDFGYAVDPTAYVVYNGIVIADSAEPRSIAELNDRGLWIEPARKGAGSVEHGILWLQGLDKIVVDPARCPNTARELTLYEYARDRQGNFRADFPDRDNHTIDALRYATEDIAQPEADNKPVSAKGHRISTAQHKRQQGKRFA